MYVCVCNAVRESDVHAAVKDGVRTMRQLSATTGCSNSCGRCARFAASVLTDALQQHSPHLRLVEPARVA